MCAANQAGVTGQDDVGPPLVYLPLRPAPIRSHSEPATHSHFCKPL